jgi:hypothetical protein
LGTAIATLFVCEIECPSFTLCHVLRLFATVGEGSFHSTKTILLNENPSWCYRANTECTQALMELSRPALVEGVHIIQPDIGISKLCKRDLVKLIVQDFLYERVALLVETDINILTRTQHTK